MEPLVVVNLTAREKGLLKVVGEREIVASIKMLEGADSIDNAWLIEAVKEVYSQYYSRVCEYRRVL